MRAEVLTCPLAIGATTLADWRAGQLPAAEMARLREHIVGCASCRAELLAYDEVARLLRQQRDLAPGDRVVEGLRWRVARQTRGRRATVPHVGRRTARTAWSGLGALAAVAALVLLAVHLFGFDRPPLRGRTGQETPTPTATATPTPVPTIGPGQFTPVAQLQDAWGSQGLTAQLPNTQLDETHVFYTQTATPDGRLLLGQRSTLGAGGNSVDAQAGWLDVATRRFTSVGPVMPLPLMSFDGWAACIGADEHYIVCELQGASTMNPGTNPPGLSSLWAYDRASGRARQITDSQHYAFEGVPKIVHGMLVFSTGTQIYTVDLAANTIAAVSLPLREPFVLALSWPYLLYANVNLTAQMSAIRVHDLVTGQDASLPQVDALYAAAVASGADANHIPYVTLAGDTLFVTEATGRIASSNVPPNNVTGPETTTTLYEMAHVFAPGAQLRPVARYHGVTGGPVGANARLVVFMLMAWDRAADRWVKFSTTPDDQATTFGALSGNALVLRGNDQPRTGEQVTIYDTGELG